MYETYYLIFKILKFKNHTFFLIVIVIIITFCIIIFIVVVLSRFMNKSQYFKTHTFTFFWCFTRRLLTTGSDEINIVFIKSVIVSVLLNFHVWYSLNFLKSLLRASYASSDIIPIGSTSSLIICAP